MFTSSYLASGHRKYGGLELGSLLAVDRAFARRNPSSTSVGIRPVSYSASIEHLSKPGLIHKYVMAF